MTLRFAPNERISIIVEDDGVAQLRLTRADKLNALDAAMFDALVDAGQSLFEMRSLRAVVMAGEGRAFCAGLDTARFSSAPGASTDFTARTHGNANHFQQAAMVWNKLPVPVIAAVHGVCFGGGLQIASGADIRVMTPDARLSIMETRWGLVPDMGGYARWRSLVRDDVLRELIYTHREFSGQEAQSLGFATFVDPDPIARATGIARQIAALSPHAIRAAKALANRVADASIEEILLEESRAQHALKGGRNQQEAVAARMEKRTPHFVDP